MIICIGLLYRIYRGRFGGQERETHVKGTGKRSLPGMVVKVTGTWQGDSHYGQGLGAVTQLMEQGRGQLERGWEGGR